MLSEFDAALFALLRAWQSPWLDTVMVTLSVIGSRGSVWLVMAAVAAITPRHRSAAWRLVLALGLTFFLVDAVIKPAVDRARPFEALDDVRVVHTRPTTASFPSGHAASAFAGAVAAARIWPAGRVAFLALAALIAFSRVYLGVHFPIDVVSGALLGVCCALFILGGTAPSPTSAVRRETHEARRGEFHRAP